MTVGEWVTMGDDAVASRAPTVSINTAEYATSFRDGVVLLILYEYRMCVCTPPVGGVPVTQRYSCSRAVLCVSCRLYRT